METAEPIFFDVEGTAIAVRLQRGAQPGVVWLGGYKSDMRGTKAEALAGWAANRGGAFLRHDYSGHGESAGAFKDGIISKWLGQSLAVFRNYSEGRQVLVASSMGAWIALRMVQELRKAGDHRVAGLVLLAPAPDFTAELVEPVLNDAQRKDLGEKGYFEEPSDYSQEPYIYTRALIEDGRANLVMTGPIDTHCPVHILQGLADADVPPSHVLKLASLMPADDVTLSLVPDGDHRPSRPQDLDLLISAVEAMVERAS